MYEASEVEMQIFQKLLTAISAALITMNPNDGKVCIGSDCTCTISEHSLNFVSDYQQLMQDYVELSSNIVLYPTNSLGTFGYDATRGQYPIEAMSALQFIKSPVRRPTVFERWSPYEIAVFEAALGHYGKEFHRVQKEIGTKTTKEVVDFYYVWKKTTHYEGWKKQYVPPYLDVSDDDADATKS